MATSTPTAVRKMYEFNKAVVGASVDTARQVASVVGDGVSNAFHIARDTGAIVVGQARSAAERTIDEARSGAEETAGQARSAAGRTAAQASKGAKEVTGQARSAAGRTAAQASKGAKEVTGQARAQGRRASDRVDAVADRTTARAIDAVEHSPSSGTPYEHWSKAELYERARELEIDGRSTMSKGQLIRALRAN